MVVTTSTWDDGPSSSFFRFSASFWTCVRCAYGHRSWIWILIVIWTSIGWMTLIWIWTSDRCLVFSYVPSDSSSFSVSYGGFYHCSGFYSFGTLLVGRQTSPRLKLVLMKLQHQ